MATHQPILRLGPGDRGRPVSAGEFAAAEFDGPWGYEREAGGLVVKAPEGQRHIESSSPWLKRLILYWAERPELVEFVVPQPWVRIDEDTDRIGDIGVFLTADGPVPPIPDRVPELMFEIVSPVRESRERDYVKKRAESYRLGNREYVVIDRRMRTVTVFTRGPRGCRKRLLTAAQTYTSPLLPGLAIRLAEVF